MPTTLRSRPKRGVRIGRARNEYQVEGNWRRGFKLMRANRRRQAEAEHRRKAEGMNGRMQSAGRWRWTILASAFSSRPAVGF